MIIQKRFFAQLHHQHANLVTGPGLQQAISEHNK